MASISSSSSSSSPPSTSSSFCDELKAAAGAQWDRVVHHKFTDELAAGTTLSKDVLKRYLIQDHRFLDAFVCLLATIVSKARCLEDRIMGCQFLAVITGAENTYFERSFEALGVSLQQRAEIPDADCTTKFCKLMRDVVVTTTSSSNDDDNNASLGEMLAVIVVCEWSYQSWGERVLADTVRGTDKTAFCTYEWVDLHSGEYFRSVVEYLRGLLDKEGRLLDEEGQQACRKRFLEAVQCEEDFFDHAYHHDL
jgi:thiaminase/transcriptional activator TenA